MKTKNQLVPFVREGFTLIELLVVVLIIGILAAIAVPQYRKAVEKARSVQALSMVKVIGEAQDLYFLENGDYATNLDALDIGFPGEDIIYRTRQRKRIGFFDFGTQCVPGVETEMHCIAVSNRWDTETPTAGTSHYFFARRQQDPHIYCCEDAMRDPTKVCRRFTSGESFSVAWLTCYQM